MPELGLVQLEKARPMPGNPRTAHRVGALVASLRRYGFGQPVTINQTTGHVIAGNGRLQALRKMKAAGEPPPEGITARGKSWHVPAYFGQWSTAAEAEAALALNGGADGSLEGDLDAQTVAQILEQADQAAREALGLSEAQADQILLDFSTPTVAPQINLDGLERSAGAVRNSETSTIHLVLPLDLAEEARAALRLGTTAEDLIRWGLNGKPKRKGSPAATAKAQPRATRREDRQGRGRDS